MNQIELFLLSQRIPPGHKIFLEKQELFEAARGEMISGFPFPRNDDLADFLKKISRNWSIICYEDYDRNQIVIGGIDES